MQVPLRMPLIDSIRSPASPCRSARMIGIPPQTLASIQDLRCPVCGGSTLPQVVSGRELEVVAVEIES